MILRQTLDQQTRVPHLLIELRSLGFVEQRPQQSLLESHVKILRSGGAGQSCMMARRRFFSLPSEAPLSMPEWWRGWGEVFSGCGEGFGLKGREEGGREGERESEILP